MANTALQLHLHVPGLFGPLPGDALALVDQGAPGQVFSRLLNRAASRAQTPGDPDSLRLQLFGLDPAAWDSPPVGPLCALGDGLFDTDGAATAHADQVGQATRAVGTGDWLYRADPVHLLADRDSLLVMPPGRLALDPALVAAFVDEFNALFREDGLQLVAPHPDRWYLRAAAAPAISTVPLPRVLGQPMGEYLPRGPDARRWISHLNAAQMLLHASALNRQREASGQPLINGLWPWGGGVLPSAPSGAPTAESPANPGRAWSLVCSEDPLVRGLARLTGVAVSAPLGLDDLLERGESMAGGPVLLDPGAFPVVRDGASFQDWESALQAFLLDWAGPLESALERGALERLSLYSGDRRWDLQPSSLGLFRRLVSGRTPAFTHWLERSRA